MITMHKAANYYLWTTNALNFFTPFLDLALRIWVAKIFFQSGLTKMQSWDSTLMLFQYEYNVPILSPAIAAYMGTGVELAFPILLFIGLLSRPAALALFMFNIIAAISYPDISPAGIKDHIMWGVMLSITFIHGPGKLSLDYWLTVRFLKKYNDEK
ncbi:MAG: DoxX family protein [Gammaproteobacteria bacterium]|nr:DoxX family protein [Gammaproteobacteria bacterium]